MKMHTEIRIKSASHLALHALALASLLSCSPDPPGIVGTWRNQTQQTLVIKDDLHGSVTQEAACTPALEIKVHRDPYDAYSVFFRENQSVYFPLAQRELFAPSELFCSSIDSVAMCRFCRVTGGTMECGTTEQKITGKGATVTHNCHWERVVPGTGTSTAADAGMSCPAAVDAGGGCRGSNPPSTGVLDASPADAGATD